MMQGDSIDHAEGEKGGGGQRALRWLLRAVLLCAPLALGAKGCEPAVIGEDCPPGVESEQCPKPNPGDESCGGLTGASCDDGEYCRYAPNAHCGSADQTGVCTAIPAACDAVYAPVCGCDDKTYPNACDAALHGVSVAKEGACKEDPPKDPPSTPAKACGGLIGQPCAKGEYCDYPPDAGCGFADQTGYCATIPEACDAVYDPVCGCDGKTYGNACSAALAGVSVAKEGACQGSDPGPKACGGLRGLGCEKDEYCNYAPEAQCGIADQTGVCAPRPEACTQQFDPVCGCDGKTYGNACSAAAAGMSVVSKGECGQTGAKVCGGLQGLGCEKDEYCNYAPEAQCGAADQTGVCAPRPEACTEQYEPVCGCDGKTYGNACSAASAGVSVVSKGECGETGETVCGGLRGQGCVRGEYCYYTLDAQCGAADQTGICRPIPNGCTKEYAPVCGCDDVTYGNKCMAAAAGVSVAHDGECKKSEPEPKNCGGIAGLQCGEGEYCNYPIETKCGSGDQFGTCAVKPDGCTLEYAPVCGCNSKTYPNACAAANDGISIQSQGECPI